MQGLCSMQSLHTIVYMYYKGQLFDIGNTVQVLTYFQTCGLEVTAHLVKWAKNFDPQSFDIQVIKSKNLFFAEI